MKLNKFIRKSIEICFCLFIVIATIIFLRKICYFVRPMDTDGAYSQIETFHSLPDNSLDVIIYGSSHAFRGVSVMDMYEEYGIGAYNYAWHWQGINTTKLFIEDSLTTQKPKVACVEMFNVAKIPENTDITAEIYYVRYLKERGGINDYLKTCFGHNIEGWISYYFPLAAFHDNWNSLYMQSFEPIYVGDAYKKYMGYGVSDEITAIEIPDYKAFVQRELSDSSIKILDEIVKDFKDKDVQVIFYIAPWAGEFCYSDALQKYAVDNDCVFLDLYKDMDRVGLDSQTDWSDAGHLNLNGSKKVAKYLGKYIVEHYDDVTDFRLQENNIWNELIKLQ